MMSRHFGTQGSVRPVAYSTLPWVVGLDPKSRAAKAGSLTVSTSPLRKIYFRQNISSSYVLPISE